MKLVYFGSGAFGLPTLQALAQSHTIAAIVTQPDKPAGRGGRMTPTPIGEWAAANLPGAALLKPDKVNTPEVVDQIRGFDSDAWVVIAFGQLLGKRLLDGKFAMNLHASLLPRWRGAAPINAAVLAGDTRTGNSVITLAAKMDAGLILGRSQRDIAQGHTAGELHDLLAADGPALVQSVLSAHAGGTLQPREQDESLVTLAPKLNKADGRMDFAAPADECRCRVHGLTPWPGVTVWFRGQAVKLLRVQAADGGGDAPGTIVDAQRGDIACGAGVLRVLELQPTSGRPMHWGDFARGRRPIVGELFAGDGPR